MIEVICPKHEKQFGIFACVMVTIAIGVGYGLGYATKRGPSKNTTVRTVTCTKNKEEKIYKVDGPVFLSREGDLINASQCSLDGCYFLVIKQDQCIVEVKP